MFGIFRKKDKKEVLQAKYRQLLLEAFELSRTDRTASDRKYAEAEKLMDEIMRISPRQEDKIS